MASPQPHHSSEPPAQLPCGDSAQLRRIVSRWMSEVLRRHPHRNMSQWARMAGVSRSTVSRLLHAQINVEFGTLIALAGALREPLPNISNQEAGHMALTIPIVEIDALLDYVTESGAGPDPEWFEARPGRFTATPDLAHCFCVRLFRDIPEIAARAGDMVFGDPAADIRGGDHVGAVTLEKGQRARAGVYSVAGGWLAPVASLAARPEWQEQTPVPIGATVFVARFAGLFRKAV